MKRARKIVKRSGRVFLLIFISLIVGVFTFTKMAPQFGQTPKGSDLERIQQSSNYLDGQFINPIETRLGSFSEMLGTMPEFLFGKNKKPADSLQVRFGNYERLATDSLCLVTWYGHSAFLIEMQGKRILIDPMLSENPSPVSFGASRFPYKKPIPVEDLTDIDFVIISHDHYDHLDYKTILKLKDEVGHFYTPLGVGSHLKSWGVEESKVTELDWWQNAQAGDLELIACPARHFSGRGLTDRNTTQWASWVIKGDSFNLYFSGDGGYGPHFKEIGEKYGPFDLSMVECGQYNEAWKDIHMMPEESVRAGMDLRSQVVMPIHWGAFSLATHEWTDPIKRFQKESLKQGLPILHPYIGQRFSVGVDYPQEEWWNDSYLLAAKKAEELKKVN